MTIYEALKVALKREPTHQELCADVRRVLEEGMIERAEQGKLTHQRKLATARKGVQRKP